jgi:hypothetical protein
MTISIEISIEKGFVNDETHNRRAEKFGVKVLATQKKMFARITGSIVRRPGSLNFADLERKETGVDDRNCCALREAVEKISDCFRRISLSHNTGRNTRAPRKNSRKRLPVDRAMASYSADARFLPEKNHSSACRPHETHPSCSAKSRGLVRRATKRQSCAAFSRKWKDT